MYMNIIKKITSRNVMSRNGIMHLTNRFFLRNDFDLFVQ